MLFIISLIFQLSSSVVSAIENITLSVPECMQTTPGTGMVSLSYRGTWTNICHYGDQKNWGKREADTACKQLGYEGGWPYDVCTEDSTDTLKLNNFDCDETATNLKDCEYDITYECRDAKVAGIHCYNTFEVALVGGSTPNIGRVEVKYDDIWSSVCYESQLLRWSFANAQVVCRELGFPGTMLAKQGGLGNGNRNSTITGYQCREDLRDKSLGDCYPDLPVKSVNASYSSCGLTPSGVSNDAVAVCTVPGYLGCYTRQNAANTEFQTTTSSTMTIKYCRRHCRGHIYRYAFLYNGTVCFCSGVAPESPVSDSLCRRECSGNNMEVCGDEAVSSAYDVTTGVCHVPYKTEVYYFGDIFNDFECDNGMEPVETTPIQCVMGSSPDEFMWNGTVVPECRVSANEDGGVQMKTGTIIGVFIKYVIAGCIPVLLFFLVVLCKRSANQIPVSDAERGSEPQETRRSHKNIRSNIEEVISNMISWMSSWCPRCRRPSEPDENVNDEIDVNDQNNEDITIPLSTTEGQEREVPARCRSPSVPDENVNDDIDVNDQNSEDGTMETNVLSTSEGQDSGSSDNKSDKDNCPEKINSMEATTDSHSDNEDNKNFEKPPGTSNPPEMGIETQETHRSNKHTRSYIGESKPSWKDWMISWFKAPSDSVPNENVNDDNDVNDQNSEDGTRETIKLLGTTGGQDKGDSDTKSDKDNSQIPPEDAKTPGSPSGISRSTLETVESESLASDSEHNDNDKG